MDVIVVDTIDLVRGQRLVIFNVRSIAHSFRGIRGHVVLGGLEMRKKSGRKEGEGHFYRVQSRSRSERNIRCEMSGRHPKIG